MVLKLVHVCRVIDVLLCVAEVPNLYGVNHVHTLLHQSPAVLILNHVLLVGRSPCVSGVAVVSNIVASCRVVHGISLGRLLLGLVLPLF